MEKIVLIKNSTPTAFVLVLGAVLIGCSSPENPTAPADSTVPTRPQNFSSTTAVTRSLSGSLVELDTATNVARFVDVASGQEAYSELAPSEAAPLMEFIVGVTEGDLWYQATGYLNPLENAPPGWQPQEGMPLANSVTESRKGAKSEKLRELEAMANRKQEVEIPGLDARKFRARITRVRTQANVESAISLRSISSPSLLAGFGIASAVGYPQYEDCVAIAEAIAAERVAYQESRGWASGTAKSIAKGQATNVFSRFGKTFIEGPDIVQAFLAAGMSAADALARKTTMSLKTIMDNGANCQGAITIQRPFPAMWNWSAGSAQWPNGCSTIYVGYEISIDGGATWNMLRSNGRSAMTKVSRGCLGASESLTLVLALLASVCLSSTLSAQTVVAYAFLYNEEVLLSDGRLAFERFVPLSESVGAPHKCSRFAPRVLGAPDFAAAVPKVSARRSLLLAWGDSASGFQRVQIVRHRLQMPSWSSDSSASPVVDPMASITDQTVVNVDFADSTIAIYNRHLGRPLPGVTAHIRVVRDVPIVQDVLREIAVFSDVCKVG